MEPSLLSGSVWLSLPQDTRAKVAELFGITKSGSVYVVNGATGPVVQSDGYTYDDLSVITVARMQEMLNSKSDNFYALFKSIVKLVNEETALDAVIEVVEEAILENIQADLEESTPENTPFCTQCDSKGVRHKKVCPTNIETHA